MTGRARITTSQMLGKLARVAAERSACLRHQHGAVVAVDGMVVSTGYNGPPRGFPHCAACARDRHEPGTRERLESCHAVHAEANALLQAGPRARGGDMYVTGVPCRNCARLIVQAGVRRVYVVGGFELGENAWDAAKVFAAVSVGFCCLDLKTGSVTYWRE